MSKGYLSRRRLLKIASRSALAAAVAGAGGLGYSHEIEPELLDVTEVRLPLPGLAPQFSGYRLVHITDIHLDERMSEGYLHEAVRRVNELAPDAVAITGDFVTYSPERFAPRLTDVLGALTARDLRVAVLGNHDHWAGPDTVRRVLRDAGVRELANSWHTLRRGGAQLHLAGVDDVMVGEDRLDAVLESLPPDGVAVLLAHEPDFADRSAATGRFALQLSGHSHGGQVRVPLLGPPVLPPLGRKYPSGLYQVGQMQQYTNRGLGMLPPRVRLCCRPEITLLVLTEAR